MAENPLLGAWKLVSCVAIRSHKAPVPLYGRHPVGRLYYDESGNMCVQIMKAGRPRCSGRTKYAAHSEEAKAAYEGYEAYFSHYSVDATHGTVIHDVQGSLFPNWTGSRQIRYYRVIGPNRILMSTEPFDTELDGRTCLRLVWERLN